VFSSGIAFDPDTIIHRIRELAFLNSRAAIGLRITGTGKSSSSSKRKAPGGDGSGNGKTAVMPASGALGGSDPSYLADVTEIDAVISAVAAEEGLGGSTGRTTSSSRSGKARKATARKTAGAAAAMQLPQEQGEGAAVTGTSGGAGAPDQEGKAAAAAVPASGSAMIGPDGLQVFYFQGGLLEYVQW
jgi:hypothetical protein